MQTPPVALIITSNDLDNQLYNIETEKKCIEKALRHYHNHYQLLVVSTTYTSIDQLFTLLNEHSGNIVLLHFAGHFSDGLNLNDKKLNTQTATNEGIASILGKEAREGILKFVFLNGCSTKSLLEALKREKVPSIIGTNYAISDGTATKFAEAFYRKLANADNKNPFSKKPTFVQVAFEFALDKLETLNKVTNKHETKRGYIFDVKDVETINMWEFHSTNPNWTLPNKKYKPKNTNGDLAIISCDRKDILKRFERNLDKKDDAKYACQFYFLAEQPHGQVESLLKRLVHHLKIERPDTKPISYEDIEAIEIDSMSSTEQEDLEYDLKKGFNKNFKKINQVRSVKELVKAIPNKHPQLKAYSHISIYFKINMTNQCWEHRVQKALQWFIETFAKVEQSNYTFIFFIIVNIRKSKKVTSTKKGGFFSNLFGRKEVVNETPFDIYQSLDEFTEDYKQATTLPPLSKVDRTDLDNWYKRYEKNAADRKIEIDRLVNTLIKRTKHDEPWDMSYVESELKKIVDELKNAPYEI